MLASYDSSIDDLARQQKPTGSDSALEPPGEMSRCVPVERRGKTLEGHSERHVRLIEDSNRQERPKDLEDVSIWCARDVQHPRVVTRDECLGQLGFTVTAHALVTLDRRLYHAAATIGLVRRPPRFLGRRYSETGAQLGLRSTLPSHDP